MIWLKLKLETSALLYRQAQSVAIEYKRLNTLISLEGTMEMVELMTKFRQSISNRIQELGSFFQDNCVDQRSKFILHAKLALMSVLEPTSTKTIWFKQQKHPLKENKSSKSLSRVSMSTHPYYTTSSKAPSYPRKPVNEIKQPTKVLTPLQSNRNLKKNELKTKNLDEKNSKHPSHKGSRRIQTQSNQIEQTVVTIKMSKQDYEQLIKSMKITM